MSCYRPCAMVVPDTELICEIMLVAEGFRDAKRLARKFTSLYNLCKELLSKQVKQKKQQKQNTITLHSSSVPTSVLFRVMGVLEPIPAYFGLQAQYIPYKSPVNHRATQRQSSCV